MFGLSTLASVLDSLDSAAKETLEEPKQSATVIRARRKLVDHTTTEDNGEASGNDDTDQRSDHDDNSGLNPNSSHSSTKESSADVPSSPTNSSSVNSHGASSDQPKISLPFNLSSTGLSLGSARKGTQSIEDALETDLKQVVRKKIKEIETLNEECIHLESQVTSLKQEVTEAWDHYKQAQERAALRESELLDEIKQIQKSKSVDKQQAVQQITKFQEDISLLTKQLQSSTEEKQQLKAKIEEFEVMNGKSEEKIQKLKDDLQEARMSTIQGAQTVREELRAAQALNEQLRSDHASIIRQMQARQQELEQENQALTKAINDHQRELTRLKNSQGFQLPGTSIAFTDKSYTTEDYVSIQKELFSLADRYAKEHELLEEKDRDVKRLEREYKALQINHEDEKRNGQELAARLNEALQKLQNQSNNSTESGKTIETIKADAKAEYESSMADLRKQAESLSQLLLKRQASVLELQAERSSLKSRVSDLQTRCTQLEQQLGKVRDLEDVGYDLEEDDSPPTSRGGSTMRKRGNDRYEVSQYRGTNRVINDLEKIGVRPGAGVTKAVTVIDSWTLFTGRVLRHHPLLRLGFVMYLLMLHLWVLFILIIHTHSLEDLAPNADPKEQLLN